MKKTSLFFVAALLLASCGKQGPLQVTVSNPLDINRSGELVEVCMEKVSKQLGLNDTTQFVVVNEAGEQVPYQLTHDGKLIFPTEVAAGASAVYTVQVGTPQENLFESAVYGRKYPERVDDVAWENDRTAYRTYGPALQANGERAFGYDVWLKRVPELVVEDRYEKELSLATKAQIDSLRRIGQGEEANKLYQSVSYHVDHGNGLDCYKVGPTLGGGAAALLVDDAIVYPYCYVGEPEILDNGPLRFTVKLNYGPAAIKGDSAVAETRIISLDKGSQMNKTVVAYNGLTVATPVAAGIVIHPENPEAYVLDADNGYVTYTDLSDNIHNGNGEIYLGITFPNEMKEAKAVLFSEEESKSLRGGASGHVLAVSEYKPNTEFTYYWGSGWSKYGFDATTWNAYVAEFAQKVRNPLVVKY